MKHIRGFYISQGNTKVRFPIVSSGSGTECPSASWCPFSSLNYKASGRKQCYAQVCERVYPSVLSSRQRNASIIDIHTQLGEEHVDALTANIALEIQFFFKFKEKKNAIARKNGKTVKGWRKHYGRTVRLNEAGDIDGGNILFHLSLIRHLSYLGINTYMYSKAPQWMQEACREAGAMVLQSERDFVAVKSAEQSPLPLCKGACGPCKRCPQGLQTAIIEH